MASISLGYITRPMSRRHLTGVTVLMHLMAGGDGYKYLLQSIAAGTGPRPLVTVLICYCTEKGTPGDGKRSCIGLCALTGNSSPSSLHLTAIRAREHSVGRLRCHRPR